MAESSIPVDLFNPGQVFACLGFVEAAEVLCGDADGVFDWSDSSNVRFLLRADGTESPVKRVLQFLSEAEVVAECPFGSHNASAWTASWGVLQTRAKEAPYPFPDPPSPATLQAVLTAGESQLVLDHWGDATRCDNVKFWAGAGGYPGAGLSRDALLLVRERCADAVDDPFSLSAPQSSSFRLDWRRDYIPLDAGFSLNAHAGMETAGYPLVEILGALGLSHARPKRVSKLDYRYGVVGSEPSGALWFPASLLRAALGGASLPFPSRRFRMFLGWPGKEGQARAITTVTEETMA
ncbi:MAG: type CRISPR-associated protein Cas8c [Pseudomonadota bacterium]